MRFSFANLSLTTISLSHTFAKHTRIQSVILIHLRSHSFCSNSSIGIYVNAFQFGYTRGRNGWKNCLWEKSEKKKLAVINIKEKQRNTKQFWISINNLFGVSSNSLFSSQHFNKQVFWNLNAIINIWYGLEFASALRLQQSSRNMAQKLLLFSIISVLILQCYSGIFGYNQLKSVNFNNKLNRILDLAKLFSSSFKKKAQDFQQLPQIQSTEKFLTFLSVCLTQVQIYSIKFGLIYKAELDHQMYVMTLPHSMNFEQCFIRVILIYLILIQSFGCQWVHFEWNTNNC